MAHRTRVAVTKVSRRAGRTFYRCQLPLRRSETASLTPKSFASDRVCWTGRRSFAKGLVPGGALATESLPVRPQRAGDRHHLRAKSRVPHALAPSTPRSPCGGPTLHAPHKVHRLICENGTSIAGLRKNPSLRSDSRRSVTTSSPRSVSRVRRSSRSQAGKQPDAAPARRDRVVREPLSSHPRGVSDSACCSWVGPKRARAPCPAGPGFRVSSFFVAERESA